MIYEFSCRSLYRKHKSARHSEGIQRITKRKLADYENENESPKNKIPCVQAIPKPKVFFECRTQFPDGKVCLKPFDNSFKMMKHFSKAHEVPVKIDLDFFDRDDLLPYCVKISEEEFGKSQQAYEKSLFCSYCQKQYDQKIHFDVHQGAHKNGEFKCSICNAPFVKSARIDISETNQQILVI